MNRKHSEIRWAVRIGKKDPYFALSNDSLGPQLYDRRKDALAAKGRGVAVKVLVKEI